MLIRGFNPKLKDLKAEFILKVIFLLVLKINHIVKQIVKNNLNVSLNSLTNSTNLDKTSN